MEHCPHMLCKPQGTARLKDCATMQTMRVNRSGCPVAGSVTKRPLPFQGHARLRPVPCTSSSGTVNHTESASTSNALQEQQWSMLKEFTLKEFRGMAAAYVASREQRQRLRDAVMAVYQAPNPACGWNPDAPEPDVLLGVVASDVRLAVRGFRDWCDALKLPFLLPEIRVPGASTLAEVRGSVYLKYNPRSQGCYVSTYQGKDRGVLVQLGQEQLGHFPLGLWDEDQKNPPPPMS